MHNEWTPRADGSALATPRARIHTVIERVDAAASLAAFTMDCLRNCQQQGKCVAGVPPHVVQDVRAQVALEIEEGLIGQRAVAHRRKQLERPKTPNESREQAEQRVRAMRREQRRRRETRTQLHSPKPSRVGLNRYARDEL